MILYFLNKACKISLLKAVLIAATFSLLTQPVNAQELGLSGTNLNYFEPATAGDGFFSVESPEGLKAGEISFSMIQMAALENILNVNIDAESTSLVSRIMGSYFSAAMGVADELTIGLEFPFYYQVNGRNFDSLNPFTTTAFGDARLSLKFNLLHETEKLPGLSLNLSGEFPTGSDDLLVGQSHIVPGFDFIIGKQIGYANLAANIGMRFPWKTVLLGIPNDDRVTYGVGVSVPFKFVDPQLYFMGEISGHVQIGHISGFTSPAEFMVGLKKEFRNGINITAGGGGAINNAMGNPRIRGLLSLQYVFNPFKSRNSEALKQEVIDPPSLPTILEKDISPEPMTPVEYILGDHLPLKPDTEMPTESAPEIILPHEEMREEMTRPPTHILGDQMPVQSIPEKPKVAKKIIPLEPASVEISKESIPELLIVKEEIHEDELLPIEYIIGQRIPVETISDDNLSTQEMLPIEHILGKHIPVKPILAERISID